MAPPRGPRFVDGRPQTETAGLAAVAEQAPEGLQTHRREAAPCLQWLATRQPRKGDDPVYHRVGGRYGSQREVDRKREERVGRAEIIVRMRERDDFGREKVGLESEEKVDNEKEEKDDSVREKTDYEREKTDNESEEMVGNENCEEKVDSENCEEKADSENGEETSGEKNGVRDEARARDGRANALSSQKATRDRRWRG